MNIMILPAALVVGIGIGWIYSWAARTGKFKKMFVKNGF